jgi:hypothetical protein
MGEEEKLLLEVFLDIHTTSQAWSQALGLGLSEQPPAPGATSSTLSDGGITKPLLTWREDQHFSMNTDDKLLGEIWRALGFTTAASGGPAGDDAGKEKAAGIAWDCAGVETVLLAGLGYVWPCQASARGVGRRPHVTKWLRLAERFLQVPRVFVCVRACDWSVTHVGANANGARHRKPCLMRSLASSPTMLTRSWYEPDHTLKYPCSLA